MLAPALRGLPIVDLSSGFDEDSLRSAVVAVAPDNEQQREASQRGHLLREARDWEGARAAYARWLSSAETRADQVDTAEALT